MNNVITSACFDMNIVDIHNQYCQSGKTKEECWEYCEENFNLMQLGLPAYAMIETIWEN